MAEVIEFNIPDSILNEFRCALCKSYLSCAPVQVLPNGKSICGKCSSSSPTSEPPSYRNLTLEALLSKLSFPCRFKDRGCEESLLFGCAEEHEVKCNYRTFSCPAASLDGCPCSWKGSAVEIPNHFSNSHTDLLKSTGKFKLELNQDKREILMFTADNVAFIMKYMYSADTSKLQYDLRYTMFNVQVTSCKIRLTNDSDGDFNCNTKIGKCLPYDDNFYNMQDPRVLILNKLLEVLDNPTCVTIMVDVTVTTDVPVVKYVDCDWLQTVRCQRCYGYLVPPIYSGLSGVICSSCHNKFGDSKLVDDAELEKHVSKANLFCSWQRQGCQFADNRDGIRKHERACQFRLYKCADCMNGFTMKEAMTHLKSHKYEYFFNTCSYKVLEREQPKKKLFTFKNNEVVFINYHKDYYNGKYRHILSTHVTGNHSEIAVTVEFEHDYCKTKSKTFTVPAFSTKYISGDDLPDCFKLKGDLIITLKIN